MVLSRRTFSALAGTAALGLSLSGSGQDEASAAGRTALAPTGPAPAPPAADGRRHTVGFDRYSMLVDGRRLVIWSGEVHPFRLPSPSLWRDVLQKLRAHGYNTVSIYVAWNYHSPAPGVHDFTGVRDLDLFLRTAAETGLYVIVRPGPYINAEVDAGGFPGWLTATPGTARTADPTYLGHVDRWLTAVDRIVARHQYTDGGGTVVLYQLENEYDDHVTERHRPRLHGAPLPHGPRRRHRRAAVPQRQGPQRPLGAGHLRHGRRAGPLPVRLRRLPLPVQDAAGLGPLRRRRHARAARPRARTPPGSSPSSAAAGSTRGAGPSSTAWATPSPAAPGTPPTSAGSTSPTSPTASPCTTST